MGTYAIAEKRCASRTPAGTGSSRHAPGKRHGLRSAGVATHRALDAQKIDVPTHDEQRVRSMHARSITCDRPACPVRGHAVANAAAHTAIPAPVFWPPLRALRWLREAGPRRRTAPIGFLAGASLASENSRRLRLKTTLSPGGSSRASVPPPHAAADAGSRTRFRQDSPHGVAACRRRRSCAHCGRPQWQFAARPAGWGSPDLGRKPTCCRSPTAAPQGGCSVRGWPTSWVSWPGGIRAMGSGVPPGKESVPPG